MKLSIIIPYHNRYNNFLSLLKNLPNVNNYIEIILISVNDNDNRVKNLCNKNNIKYISVEMDVFSISHCHVIGAENSSSELIMKMDIDVIPNEYFFRDLFKYIEYKIKSKTDWINIGVFYLNKYYSNIYLNQKLILSNFNHILNNKLYDNKFDDIPSGNLFICNRKIFLSLKNDLLDFKGYGWEDYFVVYKLSKLKNNSFTLNNINLNNITQLCRDQISHKHNLESFKFSNRLVLLHKYHMKPNKNNYMDYIKINKQILFDKINYINNINN